MKKISRKKIVFAGLLLVVSMSLSSFSAPVGGDSFTIYLNNNLLVKQYVYADKTIKPIELKHRNANDELRISYSHCGTIGKKRTITVKDQNDKILKQWSFSDNRESMTCKVKDILGLETGNVNMSLFYSSAEMPEGHVLASIVTDSQKVVRK